MTRINIVPAKELYDQHLIAEYREIFMVGSSLQRSLKSPGWPKLMIPEEFTLNQGHVKFFYNKLLYLKNRYISLYNECIKRGFNVQNYIGAWDNVPQELMNDYTVEANDIIIIKQRIDERRPKKQNKSME